MDKTNKILVIGGLIVIFLLAFLIGINLNQKQTQPLGSVARGGEYKSITMNATTSPATMLKVGSGTFGSLIVNVAGVGNVIFYDATTTTASERTISATTSLPVVAILAGSQAAGTYTYDTSFYNGLMGVFVGTQGTSTLTLR